MRLKAPASARRAPLRYRLLLFASIWAASVLALGAVAMVLRAWLS